MARIIITSEEEFKTVYKDAKIVKLYEGSFDLQLPNGELFKNVPNITNISFTIGDYVSVAFSGNEKSGRIIGVGKRSGTINSVTKVVV